MSDERKASNAAPGVPEDRLYHAEYQTWWQRAEDGRLVSADPPPMVVALVEERDYEQRTADKLRAIATPERGWPLPSSWRGTSPDYGRSIRTTRPATALGDCLLAS